MPSLELHASDGHRLAAYRAEPEGAPRAGLVVVQEIFGVNAHVRELVDGFARDGFVAVAPALFDRIERGVELAYDEEGVRRGRTLAEALDPEGFLHDLGAARDAVSAAGPVGVVGYCFGGSVAWLAASALDGVAAVASYYGSRIAKLVDHAPRVPVLMHVGRRDASFPLEVVDAVAARYPERVTVHVYDAGHGFNSDRRADYDPDASALARARTLDFFGRALNQGSV